MKFVQAASPRRGGGISSDQRTSGRATLMRDNILHLGEGNVRGGDEDEDEGRRERMSPCPCSLVFTGVHKPLLHGRPWSQTSFPRQDVRNRRVHVSLSTGSPAERLDFFASLAVPSNSRHPIRLPREEGHPCVCSARGAACV